MLDLRHICVREIYSCNHQLPHTFLYVFIVVQATTRCLSHQLFPLWRRVHDSNVHYGVTIGRISNPLRYHYANSPYLIELQGSHLQETELDLRALCVTNGLFHQIQRPATIIVICLFHICVFLRDFKRYSKDSNLSPPALLASVLSSYTKLSSLCQLAIWHT